MPNQAFMGVDLGGTGAKAGLFDVHGRIVAGIGKLAREHDVAIENRACGIGHRIVLVVTFGEYRVERRDRTMSVATVAGAFQEPGVLIPLVLGKDAQDRDADPKVSGDVGAVTMETADYLVKRKCAATFHTAAAALPLMRARGWGRIINIASAHGLTASPFKSAYIAAKHGVVGLSKTIALETAGQGITCNAICPGYVLTPLIEAQIPDQMKVHGMDRDTVIRDVMLLRQPSRQFATTEQIGGTVTYLCSPYADQVTGTTISVDGGWTAH